MRVFLAKTAEPEILLENFTEDTLNFLYHQEDQTDYRVKTISYLIDEIQDIPKPETGNKLYDQLSKKGKRRYNTILNQLEYLVENC